MTTKELRQLEDLLKKFDRDYSEEISDDRYTALYIMFKTVEAVYLEESKK